MPIDRIVSSRTRRDGDVPCVRDVSRTARYGSRRMIEVAATLERVVLIVSIAAIGATIGIVTMWAWSELKYHIRQVIRGELKRERERLEQTIRAEHKKTRQRVRAKIRHERDKER